MVVVSESTKEEKMTDDLTPDSLRSHAATGKLYKIFDVHDFPPELTTMKEDHKSCKNTIPTGTTRYTEKQGQYLAFIYHYTKINRMPPAEMDMQHFFEVSPPSVHRMLVELEKKKLIERKPGQARSIRVLLSVHQLPELL